jgi:hypothetical protein
LFKRLSQYGYNFKAPKSLKGVDIDNWVLKVRRGFLLCDQGQQVLNMNAKKESQSGRSLCTRHFPLFALFPVQELAK